MAHYIGTEIMSGAYDISCPDPECEKQGVLQMDEMEDIVGKELVDKHRNYRLNTGNT
jgi:E3 ubiquitin-protein ligase RNF144